MTKYERLRKEAKETAEGFRGHKLTTFTIHKAMFSDGRKKIIAIAECKKCGKYVVVRTHPLPNEIEIGGAALALGCDDSSIEK
jgi:hypothetical protein